MSHLSRIVTVAVAVTMASFVGSPLAHADPIEADNTGSLTIHKHVQNEHDSTPGAPAGDPLAGVEFTVTEVTHGGESLDLSTAEGWKLAEAIIESDAPALPEGFTLGKDHVVTTDSEGTVTLADLSLGLYLVTETGFGDNNVVKPAAPFWVSVPMPEADGGWTYDVVAYPKNEIATPTPTPDVTPTPTPPPNRGVVTSGTPGGGDINPAMLLGGVAFLLGGAGLILGIIDVLLFRPDRKRARAEAISTNVTTEGA